MSKSKKLPLPWLFQKENGMFTYVTHMASASWHRRAWSSSAFASGVPELPVSNCFVKKNLNMQLPSQEHHRQSPYYFLTWRILTIFRRLIPLFKKENKPVVLRDSNSLASEATFTEVVGHLTPTTIFLLTRSRRIHWPHLPWVLLRRKIRSSFISLKPFWGWTSGLRFSLQLIKRVIQLILVKWMALMGNCWLQSEARYLS